MMSDPSYLEKIKQKRALAEVAGIDLYLVTPSDLLDLGRIFADVIDVRSGS
jgi:hypothetical protein